MYVEKKMNYNEQTLIKIKKNELMEINSYIRNYCYNFRVVP